MRGVFIYYWCVMNSRVSGANIEFHSLFAAFKYSSRLRASKLTSITDVIRSTQASISGYLSFRPRKPSTRTGSNTRIRHIDLLTTSVFFWVFVYSRIILSGFPSVRNVNWLLVSDCLRFLIVRGFAVYWLWCNRWRSCHTKPHFQKDWHAAVLMFCRPNANICHLTIILQWWF